MLILGHERCRITSSLIQKYRLNARSFNRPPPRTPAEVLGVGENATEDEVGLDFFYTLILYK